MKIKTRLYSWVVLLIVPLLVVLFISHNQSETLKKSFGYMSEEMEEMHSVMDFSIALSEAVMPVNDYLIFGAEEGEELNFKKLSEEVVKRLDVFDTLSMKNTQERYFFLKIKSKYLELEEKAYEVFAIPQKEVYQSLEAWRMIEEVDMLMDNIHQDLDLWIVVVSKEISNAEKNTLIVERKLVVLNLILVLFVITLSLLFVIILIRLIIMPVTKLTKFAQELGAGDLSVRAEVVSEDELGELAVSFNRMVVSLIGAQKYAQNIIQTTPTSLIIVNPDETIKLVNKATCSLLGYKEDELVGQPIENIFDYVGLKDREKSKLVKKEIVKDLQTVYLTKKGDKIPVFISVFVAQDEKGASQYTLVAAKDLREIKRYATDRLASIAPILQKVALGDFSQKIDIPEKKDEFTGHLKTLNLMIDDSRDLVEEIREKSKMLTVQNSQLSKTSDELREAKTDLEGKIKERTEELEGANIKLRELDYLKSMFIASMSHELRTPLNSIIGFTGIILQGMSGKITEEQRKQLAIVRSSSSHLLSLINDIIDLSKIEASKIEVLIEKFDLSILMEEILDFFKVEVLEKGFKIFLDIPDKLIVESDQRRVKQVVINMVSNAVKFTNKGEIRIKVEKKGDGVEISVKDTGVGIKEEDMDKLFVAFSRIHAEGELLRKGTGLGLYLSQKIAGFLGGKIKAKSELGMGSEFIFTLPLRYEKK